MSWFSRPSVEAQGLTHVVPPSNSPISGFTGHRYPTTLPRRQHGSEYGGNTSCFCSTRGARPRGRGVRIPCFPSPCSHFGIIPPSAAPPQPGALRRSFRSSIGEAWRSVFGFRRVTPGALLEGHGRRCQGSRGGMSGATGSGVEELRTGVCMCVVAGDICFHFFFASMGPDGRSYKRTHVSRVKNECPWLAMYSRASFLCARLNRRTQFAESRPPYVAW